MKKVLFLLSISFMFAFSNPVFAEDFNYLNDLSPVQRQQLDRIFHSFKQENNSLEMRISSYKDKINQLNSNTEMSKEQINMLSSSYERNLKTLNSQQEELKKQTEALYKSVMTMKQYQQYQAHQMQVQNAFNDFLRK